MITEQTKELSARARSLENLYRQIAILLTERPGEIRINISELPTKLVFTVHPHIDDVGKLIGGKGAMFKAMEKLLQFIGRAYGFSEIKYSVIKPTAQESPIRPKFRADLNWDHSRVKNLMENICGIIHEVEVEATDEADGNTTTILVRIPSGAIPGDALKELFGCLSVLFHAIGKAQGRSEILIDHIP